jgi:uncharacterized membrane protein YdjX (TVP38/TMEM64 family)
MPSHEQPPPSSSPARRRNWIRWAAIAVLAVLLAGALYFLFLTPQGREFRNDHRQMVADAHALAHRHPLSAPLLYISVYVLFAVLALPVWWLQILSGVAFGLWFGTLWSVIAATIGSAITVEFSRVLAGDWFHTKVEPRLKRLRKLEETLGHNGFLVVMTARLIHVLPLGVSNYAFGLISMPILDVILGTFLGSIPSVSIYVGEGAGYQPWKNGKFMTVVVGINLFLLLPLLLRYLRPQWFRKIGVE